MFTRDSRSYLNFAGFRFSLFLNTQARSSSYILAACLRWPDGFACRQLRAPARVCYGEANDAGSAPLAGIKCLLTSGTVLHNTAKTPLTLWSWAAYLVTNDKRGISALLLFIAGGCRSLGGPR